MSVGYAQRLTKGVDYGKCGDPEQYDPERSLKLKIEKLVALIKGCKRLVAFTGAGISTSCGIPDFRGPGGVWTLEKQGKSVACDVPFEVAIPSLTHMALVALQRKGILHYLVTQNVDGLHRRSGFAPTALAELHGNIFLEKCQKCNETYERPVDVQGVGFKPTGRACSKCRGKLRDFVLDWDDALPEKELSESKRQCEIADVVLCLGTSLRIQPANTLPKLTQKAGGKIVIVNLQSTPLDRLALSIRATCDYVMQQLLHGLGIRIPAYDVRVPLSINCAVQGEAVTLNFATTSEEFPEPALERLDVGLGEGVPIQTLTDQPFVDIVLPLPTTEQQSMICITAHVRAGPHRTTHAISIASLTSAHTFAIPVVSVDYNTAVVSSRKPDHEAEEPGRPKRARL
eukprot:TRINITY_DN82552_c0_g1_i1.p1 TRINITY_DN82552_c0_g1~~TRINITY_DN82552_c0_g1_i1.p1  ORF type:complete len:400 (+),score=28.61 TRINITY_DN82552_c0_g1_i1:837-2036(+)